MTDAPALSSRGTLCEALGGPESLFRIARGMHERMVADPVLGARFAHAAESHVPHLAMWLTEVTGGPPLYAAIHDDISPMLRRHAGQAIPEPERARFVECAMSAVAAVAPNADPEAVAALRRYFEWGSHVAVANSQPDHVPDPAAGVPRWDWDTLG